MTRDPPLTTLRVAQYRSFTAPAFASSLTRLGCSLVQIPSIYGPCRGASDTRLWARVRDANCSTFRCAVRRATNEAKSK